MLITDGRLATMSLRTSCLLRRPTPYLAAGLLLAGCTSAGQAAASCAVGVEYEGHFYSYGQDIDPDQVGPSLGTHPLPACNDTGANGVMADEPSPGDVKLYRIKGLDPRYAVFAAGQHQGGDESSPGQMFTIPEMDMPAEVRSDLEALSR
ncbi:DUF6281 family protein [Kineosporia sp. NBRC 101731]|uniref:DUF6281 family protein n=1 Tax=Kineosporia sp. NBRC 101731 TaxID=3032199 RepID=UPI0024A3BAC7|nr:DUF6281 family protein [Kineosporia sp. NBRC 101731]GLY29147.1 hypothetical protein Kisp02_25120 [Kineosporia sp. NBRC 101731]